MPPTTSGSRVLADLNGAAAVLRAAEIGGLPIPNHVQIFDLHTKSTLTFYVRNLDELAQWSTWLDEPIDDQQIGSRVHHEVRGEIFDQPLTVLTITSTAVL